MKKKYLLLLAIPLLLVSCSPVQDELFADSPLNRINKALTEYKAQLISADNGWVMEMYPGRERQYGGYNFALKFTEADITANFELNMDPTVKVKSLYSLTSSNGPTLALDTYNVFLHYFSNPNGALYQAFQGDYEFIFMRKSENGDTIELRGNRTANRCIMYKLKDKTPSEYITAISDNATKWAISKVGIIQGTDTIKARVTNRNMLFTYQENGATKTFSAPFIVTLRGLKFYEPLQSLFGKKVNIKEFIYNEADDCFYAENANDIKLVILPPPLNEILLNKSWYIAGFSKIGSLTKAYWQTTYDTFIQINEKLYWLYLGMDPTNYAWGVNFASSGSTGIRSGTLIYSTTLIGDDTVAIAFAGQGLGDDILWYWENAGLQYLSMPFTDTFWLKADDPMNPTVIEMISANNPNNSIVLSSTEVLWPFDK